MMFALVFPLAAVALTAIALWSSQRGGGQSVPGSGNNFESYYGKNRWNPGKSPPCPECEPTGCIGSGACRCPCHRAAKQKK